MVVNIFLTKISTPCEMKNKSANEKDYGLTEQNFQAYKQNKEANEKLLKKISVES